MKKYSILLALVLVTLCMGCQSYESKPILEGTIKEVKLIRRDVDSYYGHSSTSIQIEVESGRSIVFEIADRFVIPSVGEQIQIFSGGDGRKGSTVTVRYLGKKGDR